MAILATKLSHSNRAMSRTCEKISTSAKKLHSLCFEITGPHNHTNVRPQNTASYSRNRPRPSHHSPPSGSVACA